MASQGLELFWGGKSSFKWTKQKTQPLSRQEKGELEAGNGTLPVPTSPSLHELPQDTLPRPAQGEQGRAPGKGASQKPPKPLQWPSPTAANCSRWTICTRLFAGTNMGAEGGHRTEMKHLVFKSVLGAQRNELPLIKAQHSTIRRPVPWRGPAHWREGGTGGLSQQAHPEPKARELSACPSQVWLSETFKGGKKPNSPPFRFFFCVRVRGGKATMSEGPRDVMGNTLPMPPA